MKALRWWNEQVLDQEVHARPLLQQDQQLAVQRKPSPPQIPQVYEHNCAAVITNQSGELLQWSEH